MLPAMACACGAAINQLPGAIFERLRVMTKDSACAKVPAHDLQRLLPPSPRRDWRYQGAPTTVRYMMPTCLIIPSARYPPYGGFCRHGVINRYSLISVLAFTLGGI